VKQADEHSLYAYFFVPASCLGGTPPSHTIMCDVSFAPTAAPILDS